MLKPSALKPRKRNSPRPAEKSAPGFLQWLRGRECFLANFGECSDTVEAAHVDHGGDKGMGTKVSDRFAIPLCGGPAGHHAEQHRIGWQSFEEKYIFGAVGVAEQYWRAWPGRIA